MSGGMSASNAKRPVFDGGNVPHELKRLPQWVLWGYEERNGRRTKVPLRPNGRKASSTDPSTWCSYQRAITGLRERLGQFAGVGYVFSGNDPYSGFDLDNSLNQDGTLKPWAKNILSKFPGAYAEISPSSKGVKLWVRAKLPGPGKQFEIGGGQRVEMYDRARFFAVTGHLHGEPVGIIGQYQAKAEALYDRLAKLRAEQRKSGNGTGAELRQEKIGEPNRHPALASEAGRLARLTGGDAQKTFEGLIEFRDTHCANPQEKTDQELRSLAEWACAAERAKPLERKKESQSTQIIAQAASDEVVLFHSPTGEAYASVGANRHIENWPVRSRGFRDWLTWKYLSAHQKGPSAQALNDAINTIAAKARFGGPEADVFVRLAEHDGKIYLDLSDGDWRAVEIGPRGWRVVNEPPVRFIRRRGMLPLPVPKKGGRLEALREFVNIGSDGSDADRVLLLAWLVMALRPRGPYPVLVLHGEQGSAKSTTARVLRELLDPNSASLRSEPRDPRDLIIAATNGWIVNLDNLSRLQPWLSDSLCRLSTGGGFGTRELYTDNEEALFDAKRPVIINGIEELATRGDLLDRSVILYLPPIPSTRRKPEAVFWQEFEHLRPQLLGAVLNAVSTAMRNLPKVRLESPPRMADFATWAVAAEPAFGCKRGTFLSAYWSNRGSANRLALEASPVVDALLALAKDKSSLPFKGTSTELLAVLKTAASEETKRLESWPKDGRALSNALRRLVPNLRAIGINVQMPGPKTTRVAGGKVGRFIEIRKIERT